MDPVLKAFRNYHSELRGIVERANYLNVLDIVDNCAINSRTEATGTTVFGCWRHMARTIALDEAALRITEATMRDRSTGSDAYMGCEWARCPAYGARNMRSQTFWCKRCYARMYCSELCQERQVLHFNQRCVC